MINKCVVLVPCNGNIVPECERGLRALEMMGYPVRRVFGYSQIDIGRSIMATQSLASGFDEMMWIDSDVGFHPNDVERLRSHNLPFCCGVYPKKDGASFSCVFLPGSGRAVFGVGGGNLEIKYAGFGFTHVRRATFNAIQDHLKLLDCRGPFKPWFLPQIVPDGDSAVYLGEDYSFCHNARASGIPIIADTTIKLSHIGSFAYTWESMPR